MKTRMLVSTLILVLSVLIIAGSCATRKKVISEEDFFVAFSGTWMNTDYMGGYGTPQKMIRFPDGTWEAYYNWIDEVESYDIYRLIEELLPELIASLPGTDTAYSTCYGKYTITDMWTDSKGNIWYRAHWECLAHKNEGNEYGKINDSGNTLEYLSVKGDRIIEDWDTESFLYNYRIYYRQE